MNRNEARQRAVVVNVPRDLGVEINVVDRQVTPQPTAPLIDASSFVVRRGGGHPLAPAPVDPLKDAREFVARKSGRPVTTEVHPRYACEADAKAFFGLHGARLGDSPYQENEHEKFGALSRDAESKAIGEISEALLVEAVPRGIVEQWALQVAIDTRRFSSPQEEVDWRDRAMTGFAGFAERNLGLAVSDIPTDPFLVKPSPIPPRDM